MPHSGIGKHRKGDTIMKVCFVSHHFKNPTVYLRNIIKMTPGRSGRWKDMEAVTDPFKADFVAVFDGANVPIPQERALYFGEHPESMPSYTEWPRITARAKFPLRTHLNPGEWWLEWDYDKIAAYECPPKTKDLFCVCTGHTHMPMYVWRKEWLSKFLKTYGTNWDLFGRPSSNWKDLHPGGKLFPSILHHI